MKINSFSIILDTIQRLGKQLRLAIGLDSLIKIKKELGNGSVALILNGCPQASDLEYMATSQMATGIMHGSSQVLIGQGKVYR